MAAPGTFATVVGAMESIAPLKLADTAWDNVGIMVEAPLQRGTTNVMLTIDYTEAVMKECLEKEISTLVAYHPPIFRGMKSLKLADHKSMLLLNAVAHGMSIYSPHSALDSTAGGINDWLADGLKPSSVAAIQPVEEGLLPGTGRVARFETPTTVTELVARVKAHLKLEHVRVAFGADASATTPVSSVAICAGSGGSVVSLAKGADVYVTGEMSHHDVLAAQARGVTVILSEHTLTERGYLQARLKPKLEAILPPGYNVLVSETDANPINIW